MKTRILSLANSADLTLIGAGAADDSCTLANIAAGGGDGWALIAGYGNHPHPGNPGGKPVIQRFERPDADRVVANFKTGWGRIKRALVGLPVYNGHPDAKGYENIFRDKTMQGTFSDLQAREDGLYGQPVLTTTGSHLVEDGKDRLSPLWDCTEVGVANDGRAIVAPFKLKSVGLVERGNIPGPSLMNAALSSDMKTKLIQLLGALGFTVAAEADETALANFCEQALPKVQLANTALAEAASQPKKTELKAKILNLETEVAKLGTEKTTLANSVTTLTTERDGLKTSLAGERKERAMLLANAAVTDGRIAAAERDSTVTELCNAADFTAAAGDLAKRAKKLPTVSKTRELGNSAAGIGESTSGKVIALVNARMKSAGEDYTTAFCNVQADTANAALFAAMKQPTAAQ